MTTKNLCNLIAADADLLAPLAPAPDRRQFSCPAPWRRQVSAVFLGPYGHTHNHGTMALFELDKDRA